MEKMERMGRMERTKTVTVLVSALVLVLLCVVSAPEAAQETEVVWQYPASMPWDAERLLNNTLVTEFGNHTVVEVNPAGGIVWQYGTGTAGSGENQLNSPVDAERLSTGNTLITDRNNHRVIEVTPAKVIVWQYGNGTPGSGHDQLYNPMDAERLSNNNTLIADRLNNRVTEVNESKGVVWQYGITNPFDAERLPNGNTLIVEYTNHRVTETNQSDEIVWQYGNGTSGSGVNQLNYPMDVERLDDGNTLITDYINDRVIEVRTSDYDSTKPNNNFTADSIVWEYQSNHPTDADRLFSGSTLICEAGSSNSVIEVAFEIDLLSTALETQTLYDNITNTIRATILNNGTGDASSFNVSLSADGNPVDDAGVSEQDAGESTVVNLYWTPSGTGDVELCVTADCNLEVEESDEDNNLLCENVTVFSSTHPCWNDTFDDETKIAGNVNVVVSGGDVEMDLENPVWEWKSDSSLVAGINVGYNPAPAIAFNITGDGRWNLISGTDGGGFSGFYRDGTQWVSDPSMVSALGDIGSDSSPAIAFNITGDGRWNLISGGWDGIFYGWYRDGTQWMTDPSLVAGLGDIGRFSAPAIAFNITGDGRWNLISGTDGGGFSGFYRDGTQWMTDPSLVAGLGDIGYFSAPAIAFNITGDGRWNLISGEKYGGFHGYYWNGTQWWVSDSSLVAGLGGVGSRSSLAIAFNITGDGRYNLISGGFTGGFYGYQGIYIGRIKSVVIQPPSHLAPRFYANDTMPAGTDIYYKILDASNNTIMSIEDGQVISGIAGKSFRLFAELSATNPSCTPVLHDWSVCYEIKDVDLLPTAIETSTLYSNLNFPIDAEIANDGNISSGRFNVSLYADDTEVDSTSIDDIPAGEDTTVTFEWTPAYTGNHNLTVIADCDDAIIESDETNNSLTKEVTVLSSTMRWLTFDPDSSSDPVVAVDYMGDMHVIWQDDRDGNWEIYYKKLDANGSILVNDMRITDTSRSSIAPVVAVDSTGNVYIAWQEESGSDYHANDYHIYYTKRDSSGSVLVGATRIEETAYGDGYVRLPGIAVDPSGNIHLLWEQYVTRFASNWNKVWYGKFDDTGSPLEDPICVGEVVGIQCSVPTPSPAFALDSSDNAHIVYSAPYKGISCKCGPGWGGWNWADNECPYPDCLHEIYYRKIDSGGTMHDAVRLTDDNRTFASLAPDVCVDADDNVHVVWVNNNVAYDPDYMSYYGGQPCMHEPGGYFDSHSYDLYYMKLDNNGETLVDGKRITFDCSPVPITKPSIDTESGIIYIAWSEQPSSREVYYMALGTSGGTLTNTTLISLDDGLDSWEPSLAACKDGARVVWTDSRDGNNEIYYTKTEAPPNRVFLLCPPGKWTAMNVNATYAIGIMSTMNNTETFDLTLDNLDSASVAELSSYTVTVDPYSTGEVTLNVTDAVIGDYRVKVSVESQTNRAINASAVITTSVITPKPDLTITALDAYHNDTGYPPYFNLSNEVDVTIKNIGTADASVFNVNWYADGECVDTKTVSGLGYGKSTLVQFKWAPTGKDCEEGGSPVTYTLRAIADCDDAINELNEANNNLSISEKAYWAGYSADEHINAVAFHGALRGGLNYTTGDGKYSSLYNPGDTATTHYDITLPAGASVALARLNVYYTWSKAGYPVMEVRTDGEVVPLNKSYNDRPCPSPAIGFEYPYGNYVYDLTPYIRGSGTYTVTVKNAGPSGCNFCIAAPGLVILYEATTEPEREFWILEGADLLEGGHRGGAGNLALEDCICNATFTGDVDALKVENAALGIVSAWGGSAWGADWTSYYWFNDHYIGDGSMLGGYSSLYDRTIDGMSMHVGASNNAQMGANVSDVTAYITSGNNTVSFGDDGDSMMACNAFLVVEHGAGKPPAPFMVFGFVNDSAGASVNKPNVTITNQNTDKVFPAETIAGSNYYQVSTSSWNVSAGDVLHFDASNGGETIEFEHTVTQEEMNAGVFERNLTIVPDTTPPASITNLHNTTYEHTHINWSWTNPGDADFSHTIVYINGNWKKNTSEHFYIATWLNPNTAYEIGTRTVDKVGNVNQAWVNHSARTAQGGVCGDVTGDEEVGMGDVIKLLWNQTYAGQYPVDPWAADVTGDGEVGMGDVIKLLWNQTYAGQYPLTCK